jgi:hypothetical protein
MGGAGVGAGIGAAGWGGCATGAADLGVGTANIWAHFWQRTFLPAKSSASRNSALQPGHLVAIGMIDLPQENSAPRNRDIITSASLLSRLFRDSAILRNQH